MCGGGTSYDVYWKCKDKPSRPLHGYSYATEVYASYVKENEPFYRTRDAIDRKERWSMDAGMEKWETSKKLDKVEQRLNYRILCRVFPELKQVKKVPTLWAPWTMESAVVPVKVRIQLPE